MQHFLLSAMILYNLHVFLSWLYQLELLEEKEAYGGYLWPSCHEWNGEISLDDQARSFEIP